MDFFNQNKGKQNREKFLKIIDNPELGSPDTIKLIKSRRTGSRVCRRKETSNSTLLNQSIYLPPNRTSTSLEVKKIELKE